MGKRKRTYVHVVPREDGWAVQSEGSSRAASVHDTQREAVEAAREMAQNQEAELVIHGRDGRIRERDSYGLDPRPPREPREVLFPDRTITASKKAIREAVSAAMEESNGEPKRSSKSAKNADPPPPRG
jgi:hypothetical protein